MSIIFTPWPAEFASRYLERSYWIDQPLKDILDRQATNDALAMTDARCSLSYRELNHLSERLAAVLLLGGVQQPGNTSLVLQLGNVVEFYVVFFTLLKIGVAAGGQCTVQPLAL